MYKKQTDEKVKRFKEIVDNMADLYAKKNDNYGDSFTKLYNTLGPIAGLVPLHNKLDRLTNLITTSKTSSFESVEDTLKDLACYSIMFLMEYEKTREPEEFEHLNSICCGAPLGPKGPAVIHIINGECDIDGVKYHFFPNETIKGGSLISEEDDTKQNGTPVIMTATVPSYDELVENYFNPQNKNLDKTKKDSQCTEECCKSKKGENHD